MVKPIPIRLTDDQMATVVDEAHARRAAVLARGAQSQGPRQTTITDHVGVMGEIAFSQWSGLPWTASKGAAYDDQTADVGNCEVRTRIPTSGRDLTVKMSTQTKYLPSRLYVLAWANPAKQLVELVGYTSLGTIFEYGQYHAKMDAMVYPWQELADMRFLHAA